MSPDALEVSGLEAWYGHAPALWGINLNLAEGESLGIIGRNGAGKSTLLRTIARVHTSSRGSIVLKGAQIDKEPAHTVARMGLSFVREGAPVVPGLSVSGNLELARRLAVHRGKEPLALEDVWNLFPILNTFSRRRAGLLSGGQRQMLALGTSILSRPSVLLLDEPSAGLAPQVCADVFAAIRHFCEEGLSVIIAEQNREWLEGVAQRAVLLEMGRLSGEELELRRAARP